MKKIHQRTKKKYDLSRSRKHTVFFKGIERPNRPKTYRTSDQAQSAAKDLKEGSYRIVPAKRNKRFKIQKII